MSRLLLLALFTNTVATVLRGDVAPTHIIKPSWDAEEKRWKLPELTSFEMGCYMVEDPGKRVGDEWISLEDGGAKGKSYRGLVSYTESGRTCKNWLANNPWNGANMKATPDLEGKDGTMKWGNGLGNHNYCRNPDSSEEKPWCFTADPKKPKETCNIDPCPETVDWKFEAKKLAKKMQSGMSAPLEDDVCDCSRQLFGSSVTTPMDTRVKFREQDWWTDHTEHTGHRTSRKPTENFLQREHTGRAKDGRPCTCRR